MKPDKQPDRHHLPMFVVLNGPLGVGKSTLAEALTESIEQCVMLNGDALVAANVARAHVPSMNASSNGVRAKQNGRHWRDDRT